MKSDKQLQHDVLAALEWEPSVNAAQIGIIAKEGVVTLTGSVEYYAEKMAAEGIAKGVHGVMAVANEIEVLIPGAHKRNDAEMAAAALNVLKWDVAVPADHIKVTVRNGWLTLEGNTDWQFQREAAERDVRDLIGVKGVTNQITLKPHVMPSDIKHKIQAAFTRSAVIDSQHVGVEVKDGKIMLEGKVRSWAERDEAQKAAWSAPGVSEVVNHLKVEF